MSHFRAALCISLALLTQGCAFSSKAKDWNQLSGLDGKPTYYQSTMKVGFNLLIFIPFLGDMGITGLTRDLTADIKAEKGEQVRIVQGTSENYFYGWPPFTWIFTPVICTVAAEYAPDPATYAKDQAVIKEEKEDSGSRWYKPWSW